MHPINKIILSFIFLSYSSITCALREDSKETVHIISDSVIYNYKKGENLFEGHVKANQGTTHITADKLTTKNNDKHEFQEIIAYGAKETAHYWTLPKIGDPEIHAYAKIIKFYPLNSNVVLEKNAIVNQGDNHFHGELILYNMDEETITVPPSVNGRAVVIYNPDK